MTDVTFAAGKCSAPVRISGATADTAGELVSGDAVMYCPCGTRRASQCESCAARYGSDVYHLIREGWPASRLGVTFVTLTAASYGRVHRQTWRPGEDARRRALRGDRRCPCGGEHGPADPQLGTPVDPGTYRYADQAAYNAAAPRLLAATLREIRRERQAMGLRGACPSVAVWEHQARQAIHCHLLIAAGMHPSRLRKVIRRVRLRETIWEPGMTDDEQEMHQVDTAMHQVGLDVPPPRGAPVSPRWTPGVGYAPDRALTSRVIEHRWGAQLDVQPPMVLSDERSQRRRAGYLAKYVGGQGAGTRAAADQSSAQRRHRGRITAHAVAQVRASSQAARDDARSRAEGLDRQLRALPVDVRAAYRRWCEELLVSGIDRLDAELREARTVAGDALQVRDAIRARREGERRWRLTRSIVQATRLLSALDGVEKLEGAGLAHPPADLLADAGQIADLEADAGRLERAAKRCAMDFGFRGHVLRHSRGDAAWGPTLGQLRVRRRAYAQARSPRAPLIWTVSGVSIGYSPEDLPPGALPPAAALHVTADSDPPDDGPAQLSLPSVA